MVKRIVDNKLEKYLADKRNELIWALSSQDYTDSQIGRIFRVNRSNVKQIMEKKPAGWVSPWFKVTALK